MSPDAAPEAAVFDLGGVVVRVDMDRPAAVWAEALGLDAAEVGRRFTFDETYDAYQRGRLSTEDFHRHVRGLLGAGLSFEAFERGWNAALLGPVQDIDPLLADLARRLRLVALTNTSELHARKWRAECADVMRHFERVFCSFELGFCKPDAAAFGAAVDHLALPPARVVMIDDDPRNITAAEAAGLRGIVATSTPQLAAALRQMGVPLRAG